MLCDECCENVGEYETINGNTFCTECMNKYVLVPCPGNYCSNIISLNGYNDMDDIDDSTCTSCENVFCKNCMVKAKNLKLCQDCFNM